MSASVPWSVNAVEPDTWATAREAARRSGLSVGEWLEAAIRETADEPNSRVPRQRRPDKDHLERQLEDISERLDHFMRDGPRTRHEQHAGRDEGVLIHSLDTLTQRIEALIGDIRTNDQGTPHHIKTAIERLDGRIESLFAQNRSAVAAREPEMDRKLSEIARTLETMSRRIEQETARPVVAPASSPSIAELDAAIAEITMRQSALDQGVQGGDLERRLAVIDARFGLNRRAEPDLSGLEHQLKTMADEMQALRRASVQAESIETVRREVADLSRTLSELAPRRSIETLERTIEALARRIDRSSFGASDESAREIIDALSEIRGALTDVRPAENFTAVERDLQMLSNKLDELNARGIDGATIDRLQSQTAEIRELVSNALPGEALKALVGQIEMLARKVEQPGIQSDSAVLGVISALERRIDAFAERVETAARQPAGAPVLDDIRQRLEQIEGALERGDRGAAGGLEATMQSLVDKLASAEMKLAGVGKLEKNLDDLFGQIRELRASALDVAERAAHATPAATERPENQAEILEIQERWIEPELRPSPLPRVEVRNEPLAPPIVPAVRTLPRPIAGDPETASVTSASEEGGDYPLEPGSGAPHSRGAQTAAQRVAQSEAALGGIVSKLPESSVRTSDFIAAARRAAQAAASEQPSGSASKEAEAKTAGTPARKQALFIGLMAMLVIFGAVRFSGVWMPVFFQTEPPAAPMPPAVTPQAEPTPEEKHSAVPIEQNPALVGAAPSGVLDSAPSNLLAKPEADPDPTGSIKASKPANTMMESALVPARAPAELPSSIGPAALRSAAIAADPVAAYEIGSRWFEGRGVQANSVEARRWFEIALSKGSMLAAYRLGNIYEKGYGTAKNAAEARRYYTMAAEAGNAKAMHNLAVLHAEGIDGGKPEYKTAARWFRMAADRNVRDSQYNLGVLYARGFGVDLNLAESFRWFALAAAQGDTDAGKKRDDVAARLDAQTLTAARLAVQTWSMTALDEAANNPRLKPEWEKAEAASPRKKTVRH